MAIGEVQQLATAKPCVLPSGVVRGRKNPLHFGFAQRLKRARRSAKLSHAALARLAGLGSRTTTGLLENDEHTPRVDTVERLAKALDISPSLLAFGLAQPASQTEALLCAGLPRRLHETRTAQRLTLSELGRRAGSTASQAQKLEQGRAVPTLATIEQFATALQLSPAWLAFGLGEITLSNPRRTKAQDRAEASPEQAP